MNSEIAIPQHQASAHKSLSLNVNTIERVMSVMGGSYLLIDLLMKKDFSPMKTLAAGFLLFRGISGHCPLYRSVGKTDLEFHTKNVNIKTMITVNKPRHEVYGFWRRLENLPKVMKHLETVRVLDEHTSEWTAKMPGGLGTVTWKSEIVKDEPGALLSWQSLSGSGIENAGKVEFSDAGKWGTNLHIVISYHAPLGVVGEQAARLVNPVFEKMVNQDIKNVKNYLDGNNADSRNDI